MKQVLMFAMIAALFVSCNNSTPSAGNQQGHLDSLHTFVIFMTPDSELRFSEAWRYIKDTMGFVRKDSTTFVKGAIKDSFYFITDRKPLTDSVTKVVLKDSAGNPLYIVNWRPVAFRSVIFDANVDINKLQSKYGKQQKPNPITVKQ